MTAVFPDGVSYGHVTGSWITGIGDGPDTDSLPDAAYPEGTVTFTPSVVGNGVVQVGNVGMLVQPVTVSMVDGKIDVWLIASVDADTNPAEWTWRADVRFTRGGNYVTHIEVPADGEVDLITDSAVAKAGTWISAGPPGEPGPAGTVTAESLATVLEADNEATAALAAAAPIVAKAEKVALAVSVLDHGAIGDGITDDTAAILAAQSAANGGPIALGPAARHMITAPIPCTTIVGNGATLEISTNSDGLIIGPTSRAHDLTIRVTAATWDKAALRIDPTSGFNVISEAKLSNIRMIGSSPTTGVAIEADDGGAQGVVCFLKLENVRAFKFGTGLRFVATHGGSWMNGNDLDLYFYDMERFVELHGECDYNTISGQSQPSASSLTGVRCSGTGNRLPMVIWDADAYPAFVQYDFSPNGIVGSHNRITGTGLLGQMGLTNANPSNSVDGDRLTGVVLPARKERAQYRTKSGTVVNTLENFLGIQDDVLKFADKNYAISSTPAPTSGVLRSAFRFGQAMPAWVLPAGGTITVTIDLANEPLSAVGLIGVQFGFANFPDQVTIATENSAGTQTVQLDTTTNASPVLHTKGVVVGVVHKIHVTLTTTDARTVRLAGVFASSGAQSQKALVQTDGGNTMWGNLTFGETGIGPVLVSPDGTRYRLVVADDGSLTTTAA